MARRIKKSACGLGQLSVEEFMALASSEEDEEPPPLGKGNTSRKRKRGEGKKKRGGSSEKNDIYEEKEKEWHVDSKAEWESEEEELGEVEPRPLHITSWKESGVASAEESGEEAGDQEEEVAGVEDEEDAGKKVTMKLLTQWVKKLEKTHSLHSLRLLCAALNTAIDTFLHRQQDTPTRHGLVVKDSLVFNGVVAASFQHVSSCLDYHLSVPATPSKARTLPSAQPAWRKIRRTVKLYLSDLLFLAQTLQDLDMQRVLLKQLQCMAPYLVCLPKLLKPLNQCLLEKWSSGEHSVQVLAFLVLRRTVLLQPHPALHTLLKKAYMAFVRNCKFCNAVTLPGIRFMSSCLVELLALDPPTAYQHAFVYIRQLAIHLRAALTSGKKDSQQTVYNWQFVHCLGVWTQMLVQVPDSSLKPLLYPLVQTLLGTLQVQPSAKHHPLRLHLLRMLLQLSSATGTYIPIATYILEVLEVHGTNSSGSGQKTSGKPPDLSLMLKATKHQLGMHSFRAALLNEAYLLLLQYFTEHAHFIGFPELVYPVVIRLRKVSKETCYSWLRTQLKVLVEKVEEVSQEICKERGKVSFSPVNFDLVSSWEQQRKDTDNPLSRLLASWNKVHSLTENSKQSATQSLGNMSLSEAPADSEEEGEGEESEEDCIQDLEIDSDD